MSTSTVDYNATDTLAISPNNETYRVYVKLDDKKEKIAETRVATAGKDGATWAALDKEDSGYTLGLEQTCREYKAGTIAGAVQLAGSEEEAVNIFNAGLAQKTDRKVKAYLSELTEDESNLKFEPTSEVQDTLDWIQEATQRKNLTPVEKATREVRKAIKAMFPTSTDEEIEQKVAAMVSAMQG